MTAKSANRVTKTSKKSVHQANTETLAHPQSIFKHWSAFVAGFAGAGFGIALMMLVAVPMMKNELSNAASSMDAKVLAMAPASQYMPSSNLSSANQCLEQSPSNSGVSSNEAKPAVQTAAKISSSVGGGGEGTTVPASHDTYVTRFFGNLKATNEGTNSNTGYGSTNTVTATNTNTTTVTNNNDIDVTNNNNQTAHSGDVTSSRNTTGGNATSGNATNNSTSAFDVKIEN